MAGVNLVSLGHAQIVEIDEMHVVLHADRAFPPGSTLRGALLPDGEGVQVKVTSCKRDGEPFILRGRFVTLSRALRDKLLATLVQTPTSNGPEL